MSNSGHGAAGVDTDSEEEPQLPQILPHAPAARRTWEQGESSSGGIYLSLGPYAPIRDRRGFVVGDTSEVVGYSFPDQDEAARSDPWYGSNNTIMLDHENTENSQNPQPHQPRAQPSNQNAGSGIRFGASVVTTRRRTRRRFGSLNAIMARTQPQFQWPWRGFAEAREEVIQPVPAVQEDIAEVHMDQDVYDLSDYNEAVFFPEE